MSRFLKPGRIALYILLGWFLVSLISGSPTIQLNENIIISEGDTIAKAYAGLGWRKKIAFKRYMKNHSDKTIGIQPGSYPFSGKYTPEALLGVFLDGPKKVYTNLTILEGWSSYDIDDMLVGKGLIEKNEYIDFIKNQTIIARYSQRYEFIKQAIQERDRIASLEGYLYPSTYFIDPSMDVIDQLVYLQLEAFNDKIWKPYSSNLLQLTDKLRSNGYSFSLSTYGAIILATIIEKEERFPPNRPDIASVFYNRLEDGMRIDADISLCYGLGLTHTQCTPAVIGKSIYDSSNPYNTRAVGGLPPTPIANPTVEAVTALRESKPSKNYFYLHDSSGNIHLAETLSQHNINKSNYIK